MMTERVNSHSVYLELIYSIEKNREDEQLLKQENRVEAKTKLTLYLVNRSPTQYLTK